jgi:hypothetical protein
MPNVLTLVESSAPVTTWKRRFLVLQRPVEITAVFLDFVVDGKPLRTWIQEWEGHDEAPEEVSLLMPARPELAIEQLERLLERRPHQYGDRAWLLFCRACWDEGCYGVTADIRRADGKVYWSRIGWDNNYDPDPILLDSTGFVFDEASYDRVLLQAREQFIGT